MPACSQLIAFSLLLGPLLYSGSAAAADSLEPENFEDYPAGEIGELKTHIGTLRSELGLSIIDDAHAHSGKQCLQLTGGERTALLLDVDPKCDTSGQLTFVAERWTSRLPFSFRIQKNTPDGWQEIFNGDSTVRVGRAFLNQVRIPLADPNIRQLRFSVTSPPGTGVLIDDIRIAPAIPQRVISVEQVPFTLPALIRADASPLVRLRIVTEGTLNPLTVKAVQAHVALQQGRQPVSAVGISASPSSMPEITTPAPDRDELFPVPSNLQLREGDNNIWLVGRVRSDLPLEELLTAQVHSIEFSSGTPVPVHGQPSRQRPGYAVRLGGDDGVHTSRIPGLATTSKGTLIAVYDLRRRSGGDLPGDIDVGMSRSADGGQTWEPVKVIMDQGNDPTWRFDGIGDPAVLVDRKSGTIWVAATWSHGNRSWIGSGPGLEPAETGQLMLVRSDDDGLTWSEPINITKQIKRPEWSFVLQGPGSGITMQDGTLVFAAQYQDPPSPNDRTAHRLPHSTILYSRDHGQTWNIGTAAFDDTTESQVVEIEPGVLMLNCRYNRQSARVVMITRDLGTTWEEHSSSRLSLIEPGACMGSLLDSGNTAAAADWLLFSNPDSTAARERMMIKASADRGKTWPAQYRLLLDEGRSAGYSCLTMIDKQTVGILYEGSQAQMTFQRIPLTEIKGFDFETASGKEPESVLDLFVLTGQSNSLGTVDPANAGDPEAPGSALDATIPFFWSNRSTRPGPTPAALLGTSNGRFLSLQSQQGSGAIPVFWGPEIGFARTLAAAGHRNFAVIKASRAGGGNSFWLKDASDNHMYQHVVDTVHAAVSRIPPHRKVKIAAILMLQGESDGLSEATVAGERMQLLLSNLRADLPFADDARLLIAGIAAPGLQRNLVRQQQTAAAAANSMLEYIDTMDLQPQLYDGLHFDKAAKLEIGVRLARRWLETRDAPTVSLQLDPWFQNNMMLQADQPLVFFGTSAPGTTVHGIIATSSGSRNVSAECQCTADGRWQLQFPAFPAAAESLDCTIFSDSAEQQLTNLLCGDIWICAGQSNMEWPLQQTLPDEYSLASTEIASLRLLHLPPGMPGTSAAFPVSQLQRLQPEQFFRGTWNHSSQQTAAGFSAVGWHFGRTMLQLTSRPIGLISTAVGGSPTEAWISSHTLSQHPELSALTTADWLSNPLLGEFCPLRGRQNLQPHLQAGIRIPSDHAGPNHPFRPGFLWAAAMQDLLLRPFRGVIWYQGESNAETAERVEQHEILFSTMIEEWRRTAGTDFPVVFVQLPGMQRPHWPEFRESQRRLQKQLKNTAMAVTIDLGDPQDVHPRSKQPVGERLAFAAHMLRDSPTATTAAGFAPLPGRLQREQSHLQLDFECGGDSLQSSDGEPLRHFEIITADSTVHAVEARITAPGTITIAMDGIRQPRQLRYAWRPFPSPPVNLVNSTGLPASSFELQIPPLAAP